ncbi:AMP-dependent synthetase/ligase [Nocardia sp. NPDC056611]|uniref:AMP-dependent synthetase/ligase n=1 Tax=Nocardia sp. NPDC056611 TaxID=3345877 RepID=UPI0036729990
MTRPTAAPAIISNRGATVAELFFARVRETPNTEAFRYPTAYEQWRSRTWQQTGDEVTEAAAGLIALGVAAGDRVAIASSTRYDWILADLAIMAAGAATTTVYPSTAAPDVAYILADSDSRVVFAENDEQVAKLRGIRDQIPEVVKIVTFDGAADPDESWVISLDRLYELGRSYLAENPDAVEHRMGALRPDSMATLIYTSGTTGRPKGVRLRHESWTYLATAVEATGLLHAADLQYLWLPLSHSFGKVLLAVQLHIGFSSAVDGRIEKIVDNLGVIRPTVMAGAPRIFEKVYARVASAAVADGGIKAALFKWAIDIGLQRIRLIRSGKPVPPLLRVRHAIADRLVHSKIRDRFGGRIRGFVSGSAALSRDIAEWFDALGMVVLEGYGLTETAAAASLGTLADYRPGTVGKPLPGTQIRIAEDGEVLIKGPNVTDGYHNLPDETAAALIGDGWLASGDIGELDADGYLRITDRKKDLFKTSGGKYVAPSYIEGLFKSICPLASQMVVHGDQRKFCSALITLDQDAVTEWADRHGMAGKAYAEVVTSYEMRRDIADSVHALNSRLNRWETIKRFVILDHDLSVETGELTPSLKLKRKVVADKYAALLDAFYAEN